MKFFIILLLFCYSTIGFCEGNLFYMAKIKFYQSQIEKKEEIINLIQENPGHSCKYLSLSYTDRYKSFLNNWKEFDENLKVFRIGDPDLEFDDIITFSNLKKDVFNDLNLFNIYQYRDYLTTILNFRNGNILETKFGILDNNIWVLEVSSLDGKTMLETVYLCKIKL